METDIYLVVGCYEHEGSIPLKAFKNRTDAEDLVSKLKEHRARRPEYTNSGYSNEEEYDIYFKNYQAWIKDCPVLGEDSYNL